MQLDPMKAAPSLAARAAFAALLVASAGCHTRDSAPPAPERVIYVDTPPPPPANPQSMVAAPVQPLSVTNSPNNAVPVGAIPVQPAASGPPTAPPPPPETVIVHQAPPAQVVEVITPCPGPNYVWISGHWVWHDQWAWSQGYWARCPPYHAVWVEGHWAHRRHEWVWVDGHWR